MKNNWLKITINLAVLAIQDFFILYLINYTDKSLSVSASNQIELYAVIALAAILFGILVCLGNPSQRFFLIVINAFLLMPLLIAGFLSHGKKQVIVNDYFFGKSGLGYVAVVFFLNVVGTFILNGGEEFGRDNKNSSPESIGDDERIKSDNLTKHLMKVAAALAIAAFICFAVYSYQNKATFTAKQTVKEEEKNDEVQRSKSPDGIALQRMLQLYGKVVNYYKTCAKLPSSTNEAGYKEKFPEVERTNSLVYTVTSDKTFDICSKFENNYEEKTFSAAFGLERTTINHYDWVYKKGNYCVHGNEAFDSTRFGDAKHLCSPDNK
jgi:hypothetical protein